ncbi:MAG: hypothetical protein IJO32_04405 [Bacilli bacterium]|nr:hypothetical protein [Bacilli bacterium]
MSKGYIINKNMQNKEITYIEYEKNKGFDVKPKNKLKKSDSIDVTKVVFMSPTLIEKILNKKIDKQYKKILMMVGEIASSDDDDTGRMIGVLNQVELFKSIIKKKYANFMREEQTEKLLKRLNLMGKEIKRRIYQIEEEKSYSNEYQGKSR